MQQLAIERPRFGHVGEHTPGTHPPNTALEQATSLTQHNPDYQEPGSRIPELQPTPHARTHTTSAAEVYLQIVCQDEGAQHQVCAREDGPHVGLRRVSLAPQAVQLGIKRPRHSLFRLRFLGFKEFGHTPHPHLVGSVDLATLQCQRLLVRFLEEADS